jgi:hypothetical protein
MVDSSLPNIIVRSYQLAKSGGHEGIIEIRQQLIAEGYTHGDVAAHMAGPLLKKTLSSLCRQAQGKPERLPPGRRRAPTEI